MKENQQKQSFVMYASFYDAAMGLNDEDFREYILALKDYALYGIEHTSQNTMVNGLLMMAQPLLEAAAKRREKQVKNGDYGILGGRPRKGETAEEYKARKAETLNNPMGFQNKTLNVNANVDVEENEDENSNIKENRNWNENTNVNVDVNGDVDVEENRNQDEDINVKEKRNWNENKDDNVEEDADEEKGIVKTTKKNRSNITTNETFSSNLQKPVLGNIKEGEEPRQKRTQHQVSSFNSKIEVDYSKYEERPRQEEKRGSKGSDFLNSITLEDDYDVPSEPSDERFRNYIGTIQDFIRIGDLNLDEMTDSEMMDAIKDDIDAALECLTRQGQSQRYFDLVNRAKKTYMHLYGCSEKEAKDGISRLYWQRKNDKRSIEGGV